LPFQLCLLFGGHPVLHISYIADKAVSLIALCSGMVRS